MNEQSLSGIGFKGTGAATVLFIMGVVIKYLFEEFYSMDIIAIGGSIAMMFILSLIEIAERFKNLNKRF